MAGWRRSPQNSVTFLLMAALAGLVAASVFFRLSGEDGPEAPTAVIVDQLALTQPNPEFVTEATRLLEEAGYRVDYYGGEQVTVDFYRRLPDLQHQIVVLRVHSGLAEDSGSVSVFTSEPYVTTRYVGEQRAGRFGRARYYEGGAVYFGIYPSFVASSMRGEFDDALIIMTGCWGLARTDLADALVQRGAASVVSWDGLVWADHSDAATELLLEHLVVERLTIGEAVARTMTEVGPDPEFGSKLLFYPPASAANSLEPAYSAP